MIRQIAARGPNGLLVGDPAHPEGTFSFALANSQHIAEEQEKLLGVASFQTAVQ